MPYIISYQKYTDSQISRTLRLPEDSVTYAPIGTELATIAGVTYVSLPDGVVLPSGQPVEISASIQSVVLTPALRKAINISSPHVQLIKTRIIDEIRKSYSIDDEMYFARIGVGAANNLYAPTTDEMQALTAFGQFVEGVRQWGRNERAKLGL